MRKALHGVSGSLVALALTLGAGCGGGDAGPDARTTGFDAANRTDRHYVVKRFILPSTRELVDEGKFEFPGSGIPVNKLGAIIQVQMDLMEGVPVQSDMDDAFLAGEARQLLGVRAATIDGIDRGASGLVTHVVDVDDPADPTNDYSGTAQFRLADGETTLETWTGSVEGGTVLGNLDLNAEQVSIWAIPLVAGEPTLMVPGRYSVMRATVTEDTYVGVGGSVITRAEVETLVLPPSAVMLTRAIAMGAPRAADIKGLFDVDDDDIITPAELVTSSTMATLLQPDVDLDGDGTYDHISQSIAFEAVRAELVP